MDRFSGEVLNHKGEVIFITFDIFRRFRKYRDPYRNRKAGDPSKPRRRQSRYRVKFPLPSVAQIEFLQRAKKVMMHKLAGCHSNPSVAYDTYKRTGWAG